MYGARRVNDAIAAAATVATVPAARVGRTSRPATVGGAPEVAGAGTLSLIEC
jgi:hypothetical protein